MHLAWKKGVCHGRATFDITFQHKAMFSLNALVSGHIREYLCQNNQIACGLCGRNLDAKSGGELFKGSKDAASLVVCLAKILFG